MLVEIIKNNNNKKMNEIKKNNIIILALRDETDREYEIRNKKEKEEKKCLLHNYSGQDNLREQYCRICGCLHYNLYLNKNYNIYYDDYL